MPSSSPTDTSICWSSTRAPSSALTGQFQLANFAPAAQATVWQYGEAQDTAQSQTTDGHSALANFTANLTVNGSTFSYSFPAYSMTVLDLGKASSDRPGPTITQARLGLAEPGHRHDRPCFRSRRPIRREPPGLTYTWTTTGTPPAPVTFSANGTNAAQSVTATFSKAGSYTFQVTVTDPGGYIATSSVTVTVNQTLTLDQGQPRPRSRLPRAASSSSPASRTTSSETR